MRGPGKRATVGGVALSFVLAVVIGISGVIAPGGGAALAASTTLTVIDGEVQVSRRGGPFEVAQDGAIVGPGDVIRTAADARAVLTYFEGSTVSIEPSSELAIDQAHGSPDGSTVVVMTQNLGRTWHVVTKLVGGGSQYEVRTPTGTASVRGTAFEVGVERDAAGQVTSVISTAEGIVAAAALATAADPQPVPVVVPAGFRTSARSADRTPDAPSLIPEPARRVSITVGSSNGLVVDPLGRANGYQDGRLVLQTPGAQITRLAGTLQITLPDLPDGTISTVVRRAADGSNAFDVPVITTVDERGRPSALLQSTVRGGEAVGGLEVRRGAGNGAAELRPVSDDEKKDLRQGKVGVRPELPARAAVRLGLGQSRVIASIAEQRGARPSAAPGFVAPLPLTDAPNPGAQQREEARRQEIRRQREFEATAAEQLQRAAERAGDAAEDAQENAESGEQRANAERARAEAAAQAAEAARQRAIQQGAQAANAAQRRAADEAARKAEEDKKAAEETRQRAEQEAKQKSEEAARAAAAKKAADELAKKAKEEADRLRKEQEKGGGGGKADPPGKGDAPGKGDPPGKPNKP